MSDSEPVASSSRVTLDSPPSVVNRPAEIASSPSSSLRQPHALDRHSPTMNRRSMSPEHLHRGKEREGSTPGRTYSPVQPTFGISDAEDEDEEEEYELRRQRNIRENQLLIDSLGIPSLISQGTPNPLNASSPRGTSRHKKPKGLKGPRDLTKEIYDRSGYIISLPRPGERHRIACVEMPGDRKLNKRIAEGEYTDVTHWWEGEERRWRFGHGKGALKEGEEEDVGGVTEHFRWREWMGLAKESRRELKTRKGSIERDTKGRQPSDTDGPTHYSLLTGDTCHQCKRKSDKAKMKCRNVDPVCRAVFCETCCKRYSYFEFDPDSRSFICPLCKDCCNCSKCIRKRHLAHLVGPGKLGLKTKTMQKEGITVQAWLDKERSDRVEVPFDRVRLVDQAFDIISPALPPEQTVTAAPVKSKKRKAKTPKERKPKKAKTAHTERDSAEGEGPHKLVIKFKVPRRNDATKRVKEVDSDGDTVAGYSDDDGDGVASEASSALTSLESSSAPSAVTSKTPITSQSPFLPQTNDYLASIARNPLSHPQSDTPSFPNPSAFGSPQSYSTLNGVQGSVRRRKPPPVANILRAPKHASISPPEPPQQSLPNDDPPTWDAGNNLGPLPHHTTVTQTWQNTAAPQVQTFSYDGYSSTPPTFFSTIQPSMLHTLPPPYSHSPPSRQSALGLHGPYPSLPAFQRYVAPRAGTPPVAFPILGLMPSNSARASSGASHMMLGLEDLHDSSRIHAWLEGSPNEN